MREIVSGIYTWPWFSERHGYDFNGYFVRHAAGNLCIDPVEPEAATLEELAQMGVGRILITNRNHTRAATALRTRTGARIGIHADDAAYARTQGVEPDDQLHVGDHVEPFIVIGMPGKSPGEIALHWPAQRLLIVGDSVIGNPPGRCGLLREAVMDNPEQLRGSVRRLLDLDFDTLLVGDGAPILTGAKDRLRELVASFGEDL